VRWNGPGTHPERAALSRHVEMVVFARERRLRKYCLIRGVNSDEAGHQKRVGNAGAERLRLYTSNRLMNRPPGQLPGASTTANCVLETGIMPPPRTALFTNPR
jgi:hypothetical protein